MIGAVIIVFVVLVVLPVMFLVGGGVVAGALGSFLTAVKARDHEGSELVDIS